MAQLDEHLATRGFAPEERVAALAILVRTGLVDDARFACARARTLQERGAGDALIAHDLSVAGLDDAAVEQALAGLEAEITRAERIVARRGTGARTARFLAGKGFSEDVVYAAVARGHDEPLG